MIKNKISTLSLFAILLFSTVPVYSGILPYVKKNGKIYFLIAQEAGGRDRYEWGDFSGGKKGRETPRQAAVREAAEETGYKLGRKKFWDGAIKNNLGRYFFVADISQKVSRLGGRGKVLKMLRKTKGGGEINNYLWISKFQLENPDKIPKIGGYKVRFRGFFEKKRKRLANLVR